MRLLLALFLLSACSVSAPPGARPVGAGPVTSRTGAPLEAVHAIRDAATWSQLAARPATAATARSEVVKFLLDRASERELWFVDTERWPIHYFFARDRLARAGLPVAEHGAFNKREYRAHDRRFELGSIVHYLDADLWTLELVSGDTLSGPAIARLFAQVRAALFVGERLAFRPLSERHERAIAGLELPQVSAERVFAGLRYQPLTQGVAFGTLRIVRGALDPATVRPDQILVLEQLPDEVPLVSGVISRELQAPLGHIAVLCATRGTPNMGLRDALEDAALARLDGQLVALTVGTQEWQIRPAERAEAEAAWSALRPAKPELPRLDGSVRELRDLCTLGLKDAAFAGAKAAQLGEACRLGLRTPGGFVVPVAHALDHLARNGLGARVSALLGDGALQKDAHARAERLAELRAAIEAAAVDPALLRAIAQRMAQSAAGARWIFRSSTNAEDLAGFTGAGLYRSIVLPAGADEAAIAGALRGVWASLWLAGAFDERAFYRVDQRAVAMAVLAQPFVDGARANGVAISANPFFAGRPGYFVNAQVLGGSVTGAHGEELPEQHLIYTYSEELEIELLSRSTRAASPVLEERHLYKLASALTRINQHFLPRWKRVDMAADVEFLFAGDALLILQVRPYALRYSSEQR